MGYDKEMIVDAVGFCGGIWLVWDSSMVTITEVDRSSQFLHDQVQSGNDIWLFTMVYANPALVQRRELWQSICVISEDMELPWLLVGDFNSILYPSRKISFDTSHARDFYECVLDAELIDLGFTGPPFTWFRIGVKERLDRGLGNLA
ncbi:unnamed protein product [Linum trigynum]|uniref:Endonuclease/exonuclease/phosphatase domain-containing protein n=1 Tax=Linum trigynum TaxID=586398 RepID=A0AAV2GA91_9ROSI